MSFDPGSPVGDNPIASVDQPKSKKKFWLFGGCGCLGLIAIVCIGGSAFVWMQFGKPVMDMINETTALVQNSQQIEDRLGTPVSMGTPEQKQDPNSPGAIDIRIPVEGPNGEGTVVMRIKFDGSWSREELYLEVDGEKIDLNPEKEFELDIEEGI